MIECSVFKCDRSASLINGEFSLCWKHRFLTASNSGWWPGKTLLILLLVFIVAGCGVDPVRTEKTNNPSASVDFLFEHDGCRVYRFEDAWRYHYFSDCRGSIDSAYYQSCGKNCHKTVYSQDLNLGSENV